MVDIHSHILPGIDDGAQSLEESLAMLRLAAASGTTDIVATPHANSSFTYNEQVVDELIAQISQEVGDLIKVHRGCDFHINFDNLSDALRDPMKYTVNGGRYLMVELPELPSLPVMRTALSRLLAVHIVPIVTHPERNGPLCANLNEVEKWVRDGCLMQVTGQSFFGRFGQTSQKTAEALMNSGLMHFVASDAHDCEDRAPNLAPAYELVAERWGRESADMLFVDHPMAVIMNSPIFASAPKPVKKPSKPSFWKRAN